jgi:hypothetical protein
MYKKISHNIVEEHFDHPAVLPRDMKAGIMPDPRLVQPLPPAVMTEQTMTFRMDSRTLWTKYALGMVNYSVSDFGSLAGTDNVKNSMARNAAAIGNFFTVYYGFTTGAKISDYLTALTTNGIKVVEIIKSGKTDVAVYMDIWAKQSASFAEYLNEINPSNYPKDLLTEMFVNLTKFWLDDFTARYNKDFAADAVALDNILKVGVTGVPDHLKAGYSSIADILSRGVIAQFPLLFVD